MAKVKIPHWRFLDTFNGKHCAKFRRGGSQWDGTITVGGNDIKDTIASIKSSQPQEEILLFLKMFGFDVEIIETPWLTKEEWYFVNYLAEAYGKEQILSRCKNENLFIFKNDTTVVFPNTEDLLIFIEEELWYIKDLMELHYRRQPKDLKMELEQ